MFLGFDVQLSEKDFIYVMIFGGENRWTLVLVVSVIIKTKYLSGRGLFIY